MLVQEDKVKNVKLHWGGPMIWVGSVFSFGTVLYMTKGRFLEVPEIPLMLGAQFVFLYGGYKLDQHFDTRSWFSNPRGILRGLFTTNKT